jgi:hypothetical protein
MLDDPTKRLLTLAVRDAEKRILRARTEYEAAAAKQMHQRALDELERHGGPEHG